MQDNTIVCADSSCKVVDISDFKECREEMMEGWLREKMSETYGDDCKSILSNPLLRISTKFTALSSNSQHELYGYAQRVILKPGNEISLKERLWHVLEKGARKDGSWENVEKYADALLIKERAWQQENGGLVYWHRIQQ